jgi:hypothetical protein
MREMRTITRFTRKFQMPSARNANGEPTQRRETARRVAATVRRSI